MYLKHLILITFFTTGLLFAQTGPGGVGNSSTNSLWLIGDDISQVDGTPIPSWLDRSGNGNDATQGTPGYQPRYDSLIVNGHSVVRFDGTDDYFDDARTYNARTYFSVYNIRSGVQQTSDLGQIWGSYSEGWHVSMDARGGGGTWSFDGLIALGSGNTGKLALNGAAFGGVSGNPTTPTWTYNQFDLSTIEFNATRALTRQVLGSLVPSFAVGAHQYGGDVAEIIVYNTTLNSAQRIIVENYLSAKYGLSLTLNDVYDEDDNGDYDYDVAGIGRVDASNIHNDAQGTGLVRILNPTGLDNDEFLIWGHDNGLAQAQEYTDVPAGVESRFVRVWRVSEANSSGVGVNVGDVDMRWDLSNLGTIRASDLRLLIDVDNDGTFADETPIAGATNVGGDIYEFSGVFGDTLSNNRRFTIGTTEISETPLPIKLLSFEANVNDDKVDLKWVTETEVNNDFFTIEKSIDGNNWEEVSIVSGAGNSNQMMEYFDSDYKLIKGISYYRLKQTDFDGVYTYSNMVPVKYVKNSADAGVSLFPNPAIRGENVKLKFDDKFEEKVLVVIRNAKGQEYFSKVVLNIDKGELVAIPIDYDLPVGIYLVTASSDSQVYNRKLFVK
jgi:hypothetical protein